MELLLTQIDYPQEKVPLWAVPADDVLNCFHHGAVPQICLPGLDYSESKPKIAVILAQDKHPKREKEDYTIFPDYVDAIVESGGLPYFISYENVNAQLQAISPDAVLLIGGNFRVRKEKGSNTYSRRPQTYVTLIDYATEHNLPTLAICGGMQMLSVYKGNELRTKINAEGGFNHLQKPYEYSHVVRTKADSLAESIFGREVMVNSCHNSAITVVPSSDCIASGWTEDGVVEIMEMAHPWSSFVLAVQWHPERTFKIGDEASKMLFSRFVGSAKN